MRTINTTRISQRGPEDETFSKSKGKALTRRNLISEFMIGEGFRRSTAAE